MAFDNSGDLYVGQQSVDTIAEFNSSGTLVNTIGPVPVENAGTDSITLADQCTIYYTIGEHRRLQLQQVHQHAGSHRQRTTPSPPMTRCTDQTTNQAYEVQVRPNGHVLVADSSQDVLLIADGTVAQTYSCSSFAPYGAGCDDNLFTVSLDPSGSSFWTGDSVSGYI